MSAPDSPAPEEIRHLDDEWRQRRRRIDVLAGDSALADDFLTSFKAAYHHLKRDSPVEMSQFFPPLHAMLDAYHLVRPALDQLTELHRYRDHSAEETRRCYPAEARALARDCRALLGLMRDSRASLAPHVEPDYRRNLEDRFDRFEQRARDLVAALEEGAGFAEQLQAMLSASAGEHDRAGGGMGGGEGIRRDLKPGYKQTEVGVIPEDWAVKPLGAVGEVIRGASPRPKGDPRFYGGMIPRLMVEDVTRDGKFVTPAIDFLTEEGAKRSRPCKKGTLTIVCSGTVGVTSFLAVDACIHDGFLALVRIGAKYGDDYLYHQLSALQDTFDHSATHGGVFTNLTTSGVREFGVAFPPTLAEQEAIATALSDADALIDSLEQLIAKKRLLKQGAMQDLLTGKKRLPGFEGEWEVKTLLELAEGKKELFDDGDWIEAEHITSKGFRLIQTGNIGIGRFEEKEIRKYIFEKSFTSLRCKELRQGDLLICRLAEPAGRACVLPDIGEERIVTSVDVTIFRPPASSANRVFLANLFSTPDWFRQVSDQSGGTTHKRISRGALGRLPLALPPLPEQTAIAAILSDMDAEIAALEAKLAKARQVKQGMMQELLTGKTRLV